MAQHPTLIVETWKPVLPSERYCIPPPYIVTRGLSPGETRRPALGALRQLPACHALPGTLVTRTVSDGERRTALYAEHEALGARFVPYAGWRMPVQYRGVAEEHHAVRSGVGLFDVSHMG